MDWTDERVNHLMELERLIRECEMIDDGNRVIKRLQTIITLAKSLGHSDLRAGTPSFLGFLRELATNDRRRAELEKLMNDSDGI